MARLALTFPLTTALVAIGMSAGCNSGPRLYEVSGKVTYQGEPVKAGDIVFASADGSGPSAAGKISDGTYALATTAGEKTVRITATQETGRTIEGAMGASYPEVVDLIPPQYNTQSKLRASVDPQGSLQIDFALD